MSEAEGLSSREGVGRWSEVGDLLPKPSPVPWDPPGPYVLCVAVLGGGKMVYSPVLSSAASASSLSDEEFVDKTTKPAALKTSHGETGRVTSTNLGRHPGEPGVPERGKSRGGQDGHGARGSRR
jgi:hypothetical protein